MMKNKLELKKYLKKSFLLSLIFISAFCILNIYEYKTYTKNFNSKISNMVSLIKEKYPSIKETDLLDALNEDKSDIEFFKKYGIELNRDSIILENNNYFKLFLATNLIFLLLSLVIIICLFLKYNYNKDKELNNITKYIEEINRKNYSLHIDEISEDELSILKNEIYKTTVMLKENAENSLHDKINLKKSLEDISHQLKTPLTSILVMLDNLIDNDEMDINTKNEFIHDIKKEIMNINFLVQSLLKLSKFDSNTITFIKEEVSISKIINKAINNVSLLADLRNIEIEVESNNKDCKLKCDSKWQVEALTNIIKNSLDHSNKNNKIIISYTSNKAYLEITIKDFGEGITKEDLPYIFKRFYKGKNAKEDSVGIGLALAKTITEEDNGIIDVSSSDKGTTFTIKYFFLL